MTTSDEIQILSTAEGPTLEIIEGDGQARAVVWPGMGAQLRSLHTISLGPGARTVQLRHPSEAVYYVIGGAGEAIDMTDCDAHAIGPGTMLHIDAGTAYVIRAGDDGMSVAGGPAPPDLALYDGLR